MKYPNKRHLYLKEKELKERRQETLHISFIRNMCSLLLNALLFKTKQTWDIGAKERKQLNGQTKQKKRYEAKIFWCNLNSVSWHILCKEFQLKKFRSLLSYRVCNFVRSSPVSWKINSGGYLLDFSPCLPYSMSGVLADKFKIATKSVTESETDGTLQICLNFLISAITNVFCTVLHCAHRLALNIWKPDSVQVHPAKNFSSTQEQMLWGSLRNRLYGMTVSQQFFLNVGNQK